MPLYSAVTISASVMQKRALGEMSTVLERSGTDVNTQTTSSRHMAVGRHVAVGSGLGLVGTVSARR